MLISFVSNLYLSLNVFLTSITKLSSFVFIFGKFIFNFMPDDQLWAQEATLKLDFTSIDYKLLINRLLDYGYELDSYKIQPFRSSYIILKKPGIQETRYKIGGGYAEIIDS